MEHLRDYLEPISTTVPTILVTDALGVIGHRVAQKLLAAGYPNVRVGVSDLARANHFRKQGAQVVLFDFDRPSTYKEALHGIKSIYVAIPDHENWRENFEAFFKVIKEEQVSNIVKLSICHSFLPKHDPFSKVPMVKMHRETDNRIALSSINYTIIMASHFMSNPTVYQEELLRKEHRFIGASGFKGVAYVSPNDVSDVAVKALLNPPDFQRKTLHITGAGVITDTEVAEALSDVLGTKITYENKSLELLHGQAKETNWGPAVDVILLEHVKGTGYEERGFVSNSVEKICGHSAETYDQYLKNRSFMTPQELTFLQAH